MRIRRVMFLAPLSGRLALSIALPTTSIATSDIFYLLFSFNLLLTIDLAKEIIFRHMVAYAKGKMGRTSITQGP